MKKLRILKADNSSGLKISILKTFLNRMAQFVNKPGVDKWSIYLIKNFGFRDNSRNVAFDYKIFFCVCNI